MTPTPYATSNTLLKYLSLEHTTEWSISMKTVIKCSRISCLLSLYFIATNGLLLMCVCFWILGFSLLYILHSRAYGNRGKIKVQGYAKGKKRQIKISKHSYITVMSNRAPYKFNHLFFRSDRGRSREFSRQSRLLRYYGRVANTKSTHDDPKRLKNRAKFSGHWRFGTNDLLRLTDKCGENKYNSKWFCSATE